MHVAIAFVGWLGVIALVCWRTAWQMPDGYGNAIFQLQFWSGLISLLCVVGGVGFLTDRRRSERRFGMRSIAVGVALFLGGTIGGYALDLHLGLPAHHATDVTSAAKTYLATCGST